MTGYRIALLGAGEIGGTLGRKWAQAGHTVAFGVTDPDSVRARTLRAELGDVFIGSVAEALERSDIVLLAVPGNAVGDVVTTHAKLLDGKIVIDATNQLVKGQAETFKERRRRSMNSLDIIQAAAPRALVYRAFANYNWEVFAQPVYQGTVADLIFCGPNESLSEVERLIREIGLNPVHVGGHERIDTVDDVLLLWAAVSFSENGGSRKTALKVIER